MKLLFIWWLSSVWKTATNTIRTTLNLAEKKTLWILLKRQKLGSNQSTFATFSDKKLTNFQSSLQRVWNYLSHEYCQVDDKTTQTSSERFWTWPKPASSLVCRCVRRYTGIYHLNVTDGWPATSKTSSYSAPSLFCYRRIKMRISKILYLFIRCKWFWLSLFFNKWI